MAAITATPIEPVVYYPAVTCTISFRRYAGDYYIAIMLTSSINLFVRKVSSRFLLA